MAPSLPSMAPSREPLHGGQCPTPSAEPFNARPTKSPACFVLYDRHVEKNGGSTLRTIYKRLEEHRECTYCALRSSSSDFWVAAALLCPFSCPHHRGHQSRPALERGLRLAEHELEAGSGSTAERNLQGSTARASLQLVRGLNAMTASAAAAAWLLGCGSRVRVGSP